MGLELNKSVRYVKDLYASRELLYFLTLREVQGKYKRTVLGQLWSLANPIALMLVYSFVFSFIFRINPGDGYESKYNSYALWLLCGLLPWLFFNKVITSSVSSLIANESLIQKVFFPRFVLPLSQVAAVSYNWIFEMGVLVVLLLIFGAAAFPMIPLLLIAALLLVMFSSGLALLLSIANAYFRDVEHLQSLLLQLWMFATPILYPITLVQEQSVKYGHLFGTGVNLVDVYWVNPMVSFIELFREISYYGQLPNSLLWISCFSWAAITLIIGLLVFRSKELDLAEVL